MQQLLRTLRSPRMPGNRLPVLCAPKSPEPFCKRIRALSKHLWSKPFYHLIPASFLLSRRTPRGSAERAFSRRMIECRGWLAAQLPRPPGLISQERAQTSAPLNPLPDLGRSLLRAIRHLKIQHTARRRSPGSPHQLKQGAGKSVFSVSATWPFLKKQHRNSKDFKGPAFQICIIHFQSKRRKVQETLCHCHSIVSWQILVNH